MYYSKISLRIVVAFFGIVILSALSCFAKTKDDNRPGIPNNEIISIEYDRLKQDSWSIDGKVMNDEEFLRALMGSKAKFASIKCTVKMQKTDVQDVRSIFKKAGMPIKEFWIPVSTYDPDSPGPTPGWVNLEK